MLIAEARDPDGDDEITYRFPNASDGADVWQLVRSCKPLDENSLYCNLLQCDHFAGTSIIAERRDGVIVGWISGYLIPDEPDTLFIWQVAVAPSAQGKGIARKMLSKLVERDICRNVSALKTTITDDNAASWALFSSFAKMQGGDLRRQPHFERDAHFGNAHATEHMVTIRFARSVENAA